jgi:hypothetical protein
MPTVRKIGALSLRDMKAKIQALPLSVAIEVAEQAGPLLTRLAQEANARRQNVYGDPYPPRQDWIYKPGARGATAGRSRRTGRVAGTTGSTAGSWSVELGEQLTLNRTGDTRRDLRFVVNGTIIRCALGPKYAKYLIGKYKILPIGDRTSMPVAWVRAMNELVAAAQQTPGRVAA